MKKVALLTTFYDINMGFSLVHVAETQLNMLLAHGHDPVVLVQDQYAEKDGKVLPPIPFKGAGLPSMWNEQTLDLRPVIPPLKLHSGLAPDFEERVTAIEQALVDNLAGVDVCLTHDIMLGATYKEHNVAVRRYAKTRPNLLWLHWVHSRPSTVAVSPPYPHDCRYTSPPGYIVYPNDIDRPIVCSAYNLGGHEWKVKVNRASHSIDPLAMWKFDELTIDLVQKADLLSGEVIAIYPVRLDRGKQPEKIIRLLKGVKKAGYTVRLLIVDWQSMGERFQEYIDELLALSKSLHIEDSISFSSRLNDECNNGVPRHVVQELMSFANVAIFPSRSEIYGLVVHEAMLRGCLLVLNHNLPVVRELFGSNAIYMDFGADNDPVTYTPTEQQFWNDEAIRFIAELNQNRALKAKIKAQREWSPRAMWKEFAPLLHLMPVGE